MSPTQRSLNYIRKQGCLVGITERYNSFIKQRFDLFGFADLLFVSGEYVVLVQTTSRSNLNARIAKVKSNASAAIWLQSPNRKIHCHGWSKKGPRGKRKTWVLDIVEISLSDLTTNAICQIAI